MPLLILLVIVALFLFSKGKGATSTSAGNVDPKRSGGGVNPVAQAASDALDNIAQQIAVVEGFFIPGSRPNRLNNPGNVGGDSSGGYADAGDGWDALYEWIQEHAAKHPDWDFYDMMHYFQTGDTLGQGKPGFINPDDYAEQVAAAAGVDPTTSVASTLGYS